jgi:hypothetical protein
MDRQSYAGQSEIERAARHEVELRHAFRTESLERLGSFANLRSDDSPVGDRSRTLMLRPRRRHRNDSNIPAESLDQLHDTARVVGMRVRQGICVDWLIASSPSLQHLGEARAAVARSAAVNDEPTSGIGKPDCDGLALAGTNHEHTLLRNVSPDCVPMLRLNGSK